MNKIQKFYADIKRRIKHEYSNNGGDYDGKRASKTIADYFISTYTDLGKLPAEIADYWLKNRIENSKTADNEPSEQNISWLLTAAELLGGIYTPENDTEFSRQDWQELCAMVSYEAEELPMETLSALMSIFTEKKIL